MNKSILLRSFRFAFRFDWNIGGLILILLQVDDLPFSTAAMVSKPSVHLLHGYVRLEREQPLFLLSWVRVVHMRYIPYKMK